MKKDMSAFISKVNIQIFTLHSKGIVIRGIVAGLWHKKEKMCITNSKKSLVVKQEYSKTTVQ